MAFTYSGDPINSPVDALRFALGDTHPESVIMQDAEYVYIINQYPDSLALQLASAFRAAATHFAAKSVKRSLGPQSEDPRDRAKYYADLADKYEKMSAFTATPPLPDYEADKIFYKGMMANKT